MFVTALGGSYCGFGLLRLFCDGACFVIGLTVWIGAFALFVVHVGCLLIVGCLVWLVFVVYYVGSFWFVMNLWLLDLFDLFVRWLVLS